MHRLVWVCVACLPRRRNGSAGTGEVSPGGGGGRRRTGEEPKGSINSGIGRGLKERGAGGMINES